MLNWRPEDPEMYEDVQTRYAYAHSHLNEPAEKRLQRMWRSSRDSARTPVQWSDEENAGFTTGKPWFYVNQNYKQINVAQQEKDPASILNFYRKAIHLRKSLKAVRHGIYREHFCADPKQYVYSMSADGQKLLVICSFSQTDKKLRFPKGFDRAAAKLALCNYADETADLRPYETRVYLWEQ